MRHSKLAQSYQCAFPSLEVTEAEMLEPRSPKSWTCQTIAQFSIPQADLPKSEPPPESWRSSIVRRSRSVEDVHLMAVCQNVARRMEAAAQRGDRTLLCTLEAELREMISA
jgi:hypothetical protein